MGNKLAHFRTAKGITQKEAAEILNLTSQGYGKLESGELHISDEYLYKLADFYDISVDELLGMERSAEFDDGMRLYKSKEQKLFDKLNQKQQKKIVDLMRGFCRNNTRLIDKRRRRLSGI